jgi:hypothetical protein
VAGYTWFVKFSGQKCLVLEFGGQNQTEARVHWLKMDFFLTKKIIIQGRLKVGKLCCLMS